jgi:hypothetical protein
MSVKRKVVTRGASFTLALGAVKAALLYVTRRGAREGGL